MKKINVAIMVGTMLTIMVAFMSSCSKETTPDPPGTITTNLVSNVILYDGPMTTPYSTIYQTYGYVQMIVGMNPSTLNTSFQEKIGTDGVGYTNWTVLSNDISAANIGAVGGLGDVTQKPTSGYTVSSILEVGHGYVVRYKKSYNSSDQNYFYARFYVSEWIISTSGGIIGAKVNMQYPF